MIDDNDGDDYDDGNDDTNTTLQYFLVEFKFQIKKMSTIRDPADF